MIKYGILNSEEEVNVKLAPEQKLFRKVIARAVHDAYYIARDFEDWAKGIAENYKLKLQNKDFYLKKKRIRTLEDAINLKFHRELLKIGTYDDEAVVPLQDFAYLIDYLVNQKDLKYHSDISGMEFDESHFQKIKDYTLAIIEKNYYCSYFYDNFLREGVYEIR